MGIKVGLHTPSSETAAAATVTSDSDSHVSGQQLYVALPDESKERG